MAPCQEPAVGRDQLGVVHDRGRGSEAIGGVGVRLGEAKRA